MHHFADLFTPGGKLSPPVKIKRQKNKAQKEPETSETAWNQAVSRVSNNTFDYGRGRRTTTALPKSEIWNATV